MNTEPENFTGRIIFMSMFNDISWGSKEKRPRMRIKRSARFYVCNKIFTRKMVFPRTWVRKEVVFYSRIQTTRRMGQSRGTNDDGILRKRTHRFSVLRVHCPEERSTAKVVGSYQYTFALTRERLKFFRTIISVNQPSLYGAVSDLCEECKTCNVRTERPELAGQSDPLFVPSVMKTHASLNDDPAQEEDLLQRYQERVEKLSQQDRVIKICADAGFLTTVEVGQYFMTKDTEEFSQFADSVVCREYTLPRDEQSSDPKGWIRGGTPILEVTTSYLQGKYGVKLSP